MNPVSIATGIVKGRIKARGGVAVAFAATVTGIRVFRRVTRSSNRPAIRFAVKPGEVYEIRGLRRGK